MKLTDIRANDGSRQFLTLPESICWDELRRHIESNPKARLTGYLTDSVTEVWIDFRWREHDFTINNQMGEYWLFVKDPSCPDDILIEVARCCASATGTTMPA